MKQIKMCKAIIALVVALAFVMPGSAAFANVGTMDVASNNEITGGIKNVVESAIDTKYTDALELPEHIVTVSTSTHTNPVPPTRGTIYVDDDAPPEWYDATHVHTITQGVAAATAGDTVYVYNGTYREKVNVNKQLSLIGESRNNVIVNGSGSGNVFYITTPVNGVRIDTFSITNGQYGIYIYMSSCNNIITNCNIYKNKADGIRIYTDSNSINITNCNIYENVQYGIYFYKSSYNDIINCNVYSNKNNGIYSHQSLYSDITNCTVYNNVQYGIFLYYSVYNKLEENTIYDNAYNFGVDGWSDASDISQYKHHIGPSNTINGKPIWYLVDQENITLDEHNNFGYLALISCTNITAKNADVAGILIVNTTDSTIYNVSAHNNKLNGIVLRTSSGNNVINCKAYNNYNGYGIQLYFSPDNNIINCDSYKNKRGISTSDATSSGSSVTGCNVYDNSEDGIYCSNARINFKDCNVYNNIKWGIHLISSSDSNVINCSSYRNGEDGIYLYPSSNRNNIINCTSYYNVKKGISIYSSSNNNITNCSVYSNNGHGIYLGTSSGVNLVHHNNLINNAVNAYDSNTYGTNLWDNGSAGNYWSDYTGVDANGDGIGDTPYNISGKTPPNKDRYPLMNPWDAIPPVITAVAATPKVQNTTAPVNITCAVTDNWNLVDTVKINITSPGGFTLEETMNGSYWYKRVYTTMGIYYYHIRAKDTSGNIAVSDTYSFVITDLETPTSAVAPLPAWKKAVPFAVTATAYDNTGMANVTLWSRYSGNGTAWTNWTFYGTDEDAPWSWSFTSSDGYYQFYSIAVDDYGNVEETPSAADASTGIDTVKPVTTIMLNGTMGGDNWYTGIVTVTLSATDALSGIESTWYQKDSGYWSLYTVPFTVSGDGAHTVRYYSFDRAGNREDTKSVSFKIDTAAPTTTHTLQGLVGSQGWYVTNVTVTLSASDATSGVNYTKYKLNTGSWIVYTGSFVVTTDGNYTLYYCSVDFAGNTEATKQVAFKIQHDVLPPVTTHEFDGILGENNWFISTVTVTLSAVDDSAGVASTKYKLDAGAWTTYTGTFLVTEDAAVHTLYYYSVDKVGNREADKSATFKIDRTPPEISLAVNKTGLSKWLLTATVSDETSGVAKVEFYLDSEYLGEDATAPYTWECTKQGTAQAIAYDNAGNNAISDPVPVSVNQPVPDSQSQSSPSSQSQSQSISSILQRLFNLR